LNKLLKYIVCLTLIMGTARLGFSRGDKVIPQVVDGPGWVTKFDLTNISSSQVISKMRLTFYQNNGAKWTLRTDQGFLSDLTLNLQPRQTLRVETLGVGPLTSGYAVIYDEETGNSTYSEDYVLGISVFYVFSTGSGIKDTVTVSVPQRTAVATAPVEINSTGVNSGMAIVNWAGMTNNIRIDLYDQNGNFSRATTFALQAGEHIAAYLDQNPFFPALGSIKGMVQVTAEGPISLLALLQTPAGDGLQYATLVPVDKESLRRNTYMILLQANDTGNPFMPFDLDGFAVDYFRNLDGTEGYPWDLEYRYNASNAGNRFLTPYNGAAIASLGTRGDADFDAISLPQLKALTNYSSTNSLDLSDPGPNQNFAFAVRTDLGNYAKARIIRINSPSGTILKDLVLEVCIYQ
jgi:hypothetical protein